MKMRILAAAVLLATACHRSGPATEPQGQQPPQGEVWLTPAQIKDGKIAIAVVGERDLDDTILASGTIALDDTRSGHVTSPVSGRVVQILAQLGSREEGRRAGDDRVAGRRQRRE